MLKSRNKLLINCAQCSVNYLCIARNLGIQELKELDSIIEHVKVLDKGQHLFHAKDKMDYLYAVYAGSCKNYWLDENGNERIDNFFFSGDMIGLESIPHRKQFFSLIALEKSQICVIPIEALFELMRKHETLLKRVMHITSYKMKNDQHIRITTNAQQRIADFLLNILFRLQERNQFDDYISLSMSQMDISNFLGMAHETVNRTLRRWHTEKILKINNKKIYIIDIQRLKELGTPQLDLSQV